VAAQQLTATTPEGLSNGTLNVVGPAGSSVNPLPTAADPDGLGTDAVVPSRLPATISPTPDCRESTTPTWPGRYTAVSAPLEQDATYVGLGSVTVPYTLTGGPSATLASRVWVLPAAGGPALLVTRGTYRIDEVDAPTYRPDTEPSSITFTSPTLTLRTRSANSITITATGGTAAPEAVTR